MQIISSIFAKHHSMKLEINYRKKNAKPTNVQRLNYTLLKQQCNYLMKKSNSKSENSSEQMRMKTQPFKLYGMQQSSKRKVYSDTGLPEETK